MVHPGPVLLLDRLHLLRAQREGGHGACGPSWRTSDTRNPLRTATRTIDSDPVNDDHDTRDDEVRDLARAVTALARWAGAEAASADPNEVVVLLREHLGDRGRSSSAVTGTVEALEQVNLQVALDAWSQQDGRTVALHGIAVPRHYGSFGIQQLLQGEGLPPMALAAPDLVDLPAGPDRTIGCLRLGLLLVTDARGPHALLVSGPDPQRGEESARVEVAGLATPDAQQVLRELTELRRELTVFRGQVIELGYGPSGVSLSFPRLPATSRDEVVLPEEVLARVERHALGVARHRDALRAAGQHLKRGLLLFGPPGTGKTHTTRYVVQQLQGTTVILLSGSSLGLIGAATALARDLQPAAVVLEDVDLVAEHRDFSHGPQPVLFEMLDAMDGAAPDADLLFLLTTNRADLLEPALAARPGRVDVAVEIGLPEPDARRRLLALYGGSLFDGIDDDTREAVVVRTAGVTASFVKELVRRSVLESLEAGGTGTAVSAAHLRAALEDLLDAGQSVTRALLGVPAAGQPEPG